MRWEIPEEAGFASERFAEAERMWGAIDDAPVSAFFLVYKGRVLASFGDETADFECHSVRKSFLSALYGRHVEDGTIDLGATLEDLGIDDRTPLTRTEKQATVANLLMARSGVYLGAACEAPGTDATRPERGSHPPGSYWYYNNWDFNALGTIFRQETGRDIFEEFRARIARPIGMQDFRPGRCYYDYEPVSDHPCYKFRMSARDRARFGLLFLEQGMWGDREVVSPAWAEQSTRAYSDTEPLTGVPGFSYGYLWWISSPDFFRFVFSDERLHHLHGFSAQGYGGQQIWVLPDAEMVIVFAVDVYAGGDLELGESLPMLQTLLTAREIVDLKLSRFKAKARTVVAGDPLRVVGKVKNLGSAESWPTTLEIYLSPVDRPEAEPVSIGSVEMPALAPGGRRTIRSTAAVPLDLEPGSYRVVALVDADKTNYDLRRDNNLKIVRRALEIR